MAARPRLTRQPEREELFPVQCRACLRYLGDVYQDPRRMRVFCPADVDPWCATAREWFYPNDREQEWLTYLSEVADISAADLAKEWGISRYQVHAVVMNRDRRALHAIR
ncbi:hypothetical protein ACWDTT_10650 [Streptosporangium sandarakinum]